MCNFDPNLHGDILCINKVVVYTSKMHHVDAQSRNKVKAAYKLSYQKIVGTFLLGIKRHALHW